ncbi:MAG TPA: carbon-nitrogen hydrolase family protein [bacterium]|nr:carbon-nitrogen hydrolase family protein [bacterium]
MNDSRRLNISLVQFPRKLHEIEENRRYARETLEKISGADVVCMSEVWLGATVIDEAGEKELLEEFGEIAASGGFTLLTGGLFVSRAGVVHDICHIIGPDGRLAGEQFKIFPSAAIGERAFCSGGSGLTVFECKGVSCGVIVCVDLFYPEIARELAFAGVEVIFNPANIPDQRTETWRGLVCSRAGENTVFTAFVNNTLTQYRDGRKVIGRSAVAGPAGDIISSADSDPAVLECSVELWRIADQRTRWPYLNDVRGIMNHSEPRFEINNVMIPVCS